MHCYACDKDDDKLIYDGATGRYYCRECLQPTISEILSQLMSDEWATAGPNRADRISERALELLKSVGIDVDTLVDELPDVESTTTITDMENENADDL